MSNSVDEHTRCGIPTGSFLESIQRSIQVRYELGNVTSMGPRASVDWRCYPCTILSEHTGGTLRIEYADGSVYEVEDGEAFCIRASKVHTVIKTSDADSLSRWAHVNFLVFGSVDLLSLLEVPVIYRGELAGRIGRLCEELVWVHRTAEPDLLTAIRDRALGLELAQAIIEGASQMAPHSARFQAVKRLAPVLNYIEANIGRPIPNRELTGLLDLSRERLHALFKEGLERSPSQFILDHRMRRAQQLLVSQDITIRAVAAACGYDDQFHFSRLFKARFAVSPLRYRELSRR